MQSIIMLVPCFIAAQSAGTSSRARVAQPHTTAAPAELACGQASLAYAIAYRSVTGFRRRLCKPRQRWIQLEEHI